MVRLPVGYRVPLRVVGGSSSRRETNDVSDIRETLDQLDRRLGELRRQLAGLAEDPRPAAPPAPPPARRLQSVPLPPELMSGGIAGVTEAPTPPTPDPYPDHVAVQIQQLMTVRNQLLAGARELVRAYERQLDVLERLAASGQPLAHEALPAPPAPVQEQARPAFFEGPVTLVVSGAHRIQTIQVLEDALSRARYVEQVYVRRCHRGQVWLELTLSGGSELLGEFNRVLPFPFAVTSATSKEIAFSIEGEQ